MRAKTGKRPKGARSRGPLQAGRAGRRASPADNPQSRNASEASAAGARSEAKPNGAGWRGLRPRRGHQARWPGLARAGATWLAAAPLVACAPSDRELLADARGALTSAAYGDAVAAADSGLARRGDPRVAWGLELVKLEAQARAGQAESAKEQLAKLARLHPERIPPTQYSATADQLRSAGQGAAAIQVLDMGLKRFPENATLARLIGDAGTGDVDPAEVEMLKSLGYL